MAFAHNAAAGLKDFFKLGSKTLELQSLSKSKGYTEDWSIEKLRPDHCSVPGAKQEARWIQETLQQLEVKGEDGTDQIYVWELLHLVA